MTLSSASSAPLIAILQSKPKRRLLVVAALSMFMGYIAFMISTPQSASSNQHYHHHGHHHHHRVQQLPNLAASQSSSSSLSSSSWFSSSSSAWTTGNHEEEDIDENEDTPNNSKEEEEETRDKPTHRNTNDDMVISIDDSSSSSSSKNSINSESSSSFSCDPDDATACHHPKGVCQKATRTCLCATLWHGNQCEKPYTLKGKHIKAKIEKGLGFAGSITMSKKVTGKRKNIEVTLPGKEKDADKGHRVLGPVDQELLSIMPQNDAVGEVHDKCAVVGSSGILLNYENGKFIDEHDAVFRFNSAPTKGGLEAHAGSKTTYRITNTQNWAFREGKELLLVHMRSHASLSAFIKTRKGDKSIKMAAFDQGFVEHMAHSLNFMPTSGLYGIIIALSRCHEVNLFGFQVSSEHGALYHYYDACDEPANGERDGAEWLVVKKLAEEKLVKFAEPCVVECHESKSKCQECKDEAGMPTVDLSNFRATSLRMKGQDLKRELTKQTYAERKKSCPACSKSFGGCRPPRHWAYARDRSSSRHGSGSHVHG